VAGQPRGGRSDWDWDLDSDWDLDLDLDRPPPCLAASSSSSSSSAGAAWKRASCHFSLSHPCLYSHIGRQAGADGGLTLAGLASRSGAANSAGAD